MTARQLPLHWNGRAPDPSQADRIILGDCRSVLPEIPANSVDLIVTSPPYADSRKKTYGGIHPDAYVEWFLPISAELLRVLKPTGTFILNIKEKVVEGEPVRGRFLTVWQTQGREQGAATASARDGKGAACAG